MRRSTFQTMNTCDDSLESEWPQRRLLSSNWLQSSVYVNTFSLYEHSTHLEVEMLISNCETSVNIDELIFQPIFITIFVVVVVAKMDSIPSANFQNRSGVCVLLLMQCKIIDSNRIKAGSLYVPSSYSVSIFSFFEKLCSNPGKWDTISLFDSSLMLCICCRKVHQMKR